MKIKEPEKSNSRFLRRKNYLQKAVANNFIEKYCLQIEIEGQSAYDFHGFAFQNGWRELPLTRRINGCVS
jgi:hypothetical protein